MPEKRYDGKLLFKTWCEWGRASSNDRLIAFSKANFGVGSQMGAYYAMWRYAFDNPEEAFEYWRDFWFNTYPDREQPAKFENFLLEVKKRAEKNPSVASTKRLERWCAKYNLQMDYRIEPNDIIQVTKRDSHLYQKLLIVDGIEDKFVSAYFLYPDGTRTNHELKVGEFGVIGPSIV
jgi:hypothetical protein